MRKIILLFLIVSILTLNVSAERFVNYEFKEAIVDNNGNVVQTNTQIQDVNAIGFVCEEEYVNAEGKSICSRLGQQIFNGQVLTTQGNTLHATYPTQLLSNEGYAVYFFKEGYIPWEQRADWAGSAFDVEGPFLKYLGKKTSCNAPVTSLTITDRANPNLPILVNANVGIDAQTHSIIKSAGVIDPVPDQIRDQYSINTRVYLFVESNTQPRTLLETRDVNVFFDEVRDLQFEWVPQVNDNYFVTLVTEIIDEKCLDTTDMEAAKFIQVQDSLPIEGYYTLINDLDFEPVFPRAGDSLVISIEKITNFVNSDGSLRPEETLLDVVITDKDGNGVLFEEVVLAPNSNSVDTQEFEFTVDIPTDALPGEYRISVVGQANAGCFIFFCPFTNLVDAITATFVLTGEGNTPGNQAPDIDFSSIGNVLFVSEGDHVILDLLNFATDPDGDELSFDIVDKDGDIDCWIEDDSLHCENVDDEGELEIQVSDGQLTDSDFLEIEVFDGNPVGLSITSVPVTTAKVNSQYKYDVQVFNPNFEQLQFNLDIAPKGMTIDYQGLIKWVPDKLGNELVIVRVNDGFNTVTQSFVITVDSKVFKSHNLEITGLEFDEEQVQAGDLIRGFVQVKNKGQSKEDRIDVDINIPELNVFTDISSDLKLNSGNSVWLEFEFEVPENAEKGKYLVEVKAHNRNELEYLNSEITIY